MRKAIGTFTEKLKALLILVVLMMSPIAYRVRRGKGDPGNARLRSLTASPLICLPLPEGYEVLSVESTPTHWSHGPLGSYQLQAAVAAVHDEAERVDDTDWPQVLALYELLDRVSPNPMATLNRAIAVAMVRGTQSGLDLLATRYEDRRVSEHHLFYTVKGHLLDMAASHDTAREAFEIAARRTTSLPEKRYLYKRSQQVVAHRRREPEVAGCDGQDAPPRN